MGYTWSSEKCDKELWKKVPISGKELCMAMEGSDIHEITMENMVEVARYIHNQGVLSDTRTDEPMAYGDIRIMVFCAVGFHREWG